MVCYHNCYMFKINLIKNIVGNASKVALKSLVVSFSVVLLLATPVFAQGPTYSCGSYGASGYQANCPSTSGGSSTTSAGSSARPESYSAGSGYDTKTTSGQAGQPPANKSNQVSYQQSQSGRSIPLNTKQSAPKQSPKTRLAAIVFFVLLILLALLILLITLKRRHDSSKPSLFE